MADELLTLREEAVRAKNAAGTTLSKVTDRTENLKDILLMSQQALINVQSKIEAQTTVQSREMGALRDTLDRLRRDTSVKDEELSMFKVRWADMMRDVRSAREDLAAARTQPQSNPFPAASGPGNGITISIVPAGSDQPITWRMALPE
jgi:septal ring factor EnvC (AmiA/AmiB activator)